MNGTPSHETTKGSLQPVSLIATAIQYTFESSCWQQLFDWTASFGIEVGNGIQPRNPELRTAIDFGVWGKLRLYS